MKNIRATVIPGQPVKHTFHSIEFGHEVRGRSNQCKGFISSADAGGEAPDYRDRPGTEVRQILSQGYRVTVCLYDLLFETEIGILLPE